MTVQVFYSDCMTVILNDVVVMYTNIIIKYRHNIL